MSKNKGGHTTSLELYKLVFVLFYTPYLHVCLPKFQKMAASIFLKKRGVAHCAGNLKIQGRLTEAHAGCFNLLKQRRKASELMKVLNFLFTSIHSSFSHEASVKDFARFFLF